MSYVFTPISGSRRSADFPRVSPEEQAARDATAKQVVANEFEQDMPEENRAALETEYRQRFNAEPPTTTSTSWTFTPLDGTKPNDTAYKFTPLDAEKPSVFAPALRTVEDIGRVYPVAETAANLATQMVALPAAGLAGLGALATNALGFTDADPSEVIHKVGGALTYQPQTESGKHLTQTVMQPFEKLQEAGQWAGGKVLDATGSPVAATAVDTAINVLPMLIAPAFKGAKSVKENYSRRSSDAPADTAATRGADATNTEPAKENRGQSEDAPGGQGGAGGNEATSRASAASDVAQYRFIPLEDANVQRNPSLPAGTERVAGNDPALHGTEAASMEILRREGDQGLPGVDGELPAVSPGHGNGTDTAALAGQAGRDVELRTNELRLDGAATPNEAARVLPEGDYPRPANDNGGSGAPSWVSARHIESAHESRVAAGHGADAEAMPNGATQKTARYALIEADDLKASHDANLRPVTENPFGRQGATRQEHETAVQEIVKDFDPSRMIDALDDASGAPVVARDGVVEAGQRRAVALQRVYQANGLKAESYRQHLRDNAERLGLDPANIDAMKKPVLVRVPDEPAPRNHFEAAGRELSGLREINPEALKALSPESQEAVAFLHANSHNPTAIKEFSERVKAAMSEPDEAVPVRAQNGEAIEVRKTSPQDPGEALSMAATTGPETLNAWAPGMNYVPLVDDARLPAGTAKTVADLPAPLRRENIIKDFAQGIGTSIYEGRVKGKKLGFFRPRNEEVRIKKANDIEVVAHEVAHLIDSRVPAIANAWRSNKALREELKTVSYDQQSVKEGFAEGVRLFLTQPDALQAKAPMVHAWLEDFAKTHEYGPALRKAQADMTAWYGQDALNRARSKIGDPGKFSNSPIMQYLGDWWEKQRSQFRQSVFDDLAGIYDAERSLTGKIAPGGAYEVARLSRSAPAITDGTVRFGAPLRKPDGSRTFTGKGLHEILQPVAGRIDDFLLYAVGRSAHELMGQGREHLFTKSEIQAMVQMETPEFRKALNEFQTWNRAVVDFAQAYGVVNAESRAMWNRQIYLPFWRVSQPGEWRGGKMGDWKGVQALSGGTSNVRDVLSNIIGNANLLITKALVNDARARTIKLIEENKGGRYLVEIPKESRPVKISGDQVAEAMRKHYGIVINEPGYFDFMLTNQAPAGGNVIAVLENGRPRYFEVGDPLLFRAMSALERPPQHWLVKWLGLPRRIGQASITLDLTFIAKNLARDQVMAGVMTRTGFRPMIDAMSGLRSRLATDETFKSFIANGGGLSSLFLDDAALRKNLDRFYADHGINAKTVLDAPGKMLYFVERVGEAIEAATRIGEYKRAIERGEHPRHAAYLSRDVSVDWAAKGDSKALSVAFDTVMFLRAAVVSMDRVYRGIAHDPNRGAIAVKTGAIALASTLLYLMNRGRPEYDDMEDWKKDAFWHVWIGNEHFMMPKAFEVGAVASIGERTAERLLDDDPASLGKDYIRIIGNVFGLNWKPQFVAPFYDQATNRNGFTRAPIETQGMEDIQPAFRVKPYTSETMKKLGELTGDLPEQYQFNPVRAEALLRGYLNAWGGYALIATDAMVSDGKAPAMRTDQLPVVKGFYSQDPLLRTRYENQFWEMLGEAKRLRGTLKELDDLGRSDWADRKEQQPLAGEAKPLERAAKNLSGINKDMEAVRRDAAMTPAEKRQKLDTLTVERNSLLKDAVLESKKAQKQKPPTPADIARQGVLQR